MTYAAKNKNTKSNQNQAPLEQNTKPIEIP